MIEPQVIINQLFEMQAKIKEAGLESSYERNFNRIFNFLEENGYVVLNPTGEPYQETRTDCEVTISGRLSSKMKITRTIKPIIYLRKGENSQLLQKGVVIAESN